MSKSTRLVRALVFAAGLLFASAAPVNAAPVQWAKVNLTVLPEQSGSAMLISGQLPGGVALPADVELAAPAGSAVQWAGEILGGDPAKDPSVTYTKVAQQGRDVYRFRLGRGRTGQIEVAAPGVITTDGKSYVASLAWTPSQDVPEVLLAVRLPKGATVTSAAAGATLVPADQAGFGYYSKEFAGVKAGRPVALSFAYAAPEAAVTPAAAVPATGGSGPLPVLPVLAFAAFVALVIAVLQRSRRAKAEQQASDPGEPNEASAVDATPRSGTSSRRLAIMVVAVFAGVILVVSTVASNASTKWVDGKITRQFAAANACSKAEIPLTPTGDLERNGGKLLASLQQLTGIKSATLYAEGPRIEVDYCRSSTSEAAIRETLERTGIVRTAAAPSAATSATPVSE